jgi:hypothetical protein
MATISADQAASDAQSGFLAALPLYKQTRTHLHALVQSWMDTLSAWQAVAITGQFVPSSTPQAAAKRREALRLCLALDIKISQLRTQANKEKQMARQVAANIEIKRLMIERQKITTSL